MNWDHRLEPPDEPSATEIDAAADYYGLDPDEVTTETVADYIEERKQS